MGAQGTQVGTGGHRQALSPHSRQQVQELEAQRAQAQRELLEAREALSRALLEAELARDEQEALAEALGKVGTRACPTAGTDMGASPWVQVHSHRCPQVPAPPWVQPRAPAAPMSQFHKCPHVPQMSPSAPVPLHVPRTPQAQVSPVPQLSPCPAGAPRPQ